MKLLDLFTGTGSVARVARDLGYEVTTLDIDKRCSPDICADILTFDYTTLDKYDVVWASPPCNTFSHARKSNIGRNGYTAESLARDIEEIGLPILRRTQELIDYLKPTYFFIENPYTGEMKKYIEEKPYVFDYCMFGFDYRKRTALWSNKPLKSCMCDRSHLIDGKHKTTSIGSSKTQKGQGGGDSKIGRYAIPQLLLVYLLNLK
jgi:hypothetical protein